MPIRAENRDRYPADWKQVSKRIRFERAAGHCAWLDASAQMWDEGTEWTEGLILARAYLGEVTS